MKTIVIHNPAREDRLANIDELRKHFPNLIVMPACVPAWERNDAARAVRGCTVSHLIAAQQCVVSNEPVLVLEDDAVMVGEIPSLESLPLPVGMVLLGGEAPHAGDECRQGFRPLLPPFFGTQAVLYLPRPNIFAFLLRALTEASQKSFGHEEGDTCAESIIYSSGQATNYHICRPNKMVFTTLGDKSEAFGTIQEARNLAWEIQEQGSLLPLSTWDVVFTPWAGKKAAILPIPGNAGDALINAATLQLFRRHNIEPVNVTQAEVVFHPGGGSIGTYQFNAAEMLGRAGVPKVILPHTLGGHDPCLDLADEVWVRDLTSLEWCPRARFAPDLALAYRTVLVQKPTQEKEFAFREDMERAVFLKGSGDPVVGCPDHYQYLVKASRSKHIHTNRLHYAIAGLIMGREVTLYPNSYHKNRSVWEASLADLGCNWKDAL